MSKGTKVWIVLLGLGVLTACSAPAWAGAVSEKRKAQNKLLAYRAARVDAMRKLAERIAGLNITSETFVRDFVAESDTIQTELRAFIRGAKEIGAPKYSEDGTCELVMEIKLKELIVALKKIYSEHSTKKILTIKDFEKMSVTTKIKVIRETGMGVPRPELMEEPLSEVVEGNLMSPTHLSGEAKAYWLAHCTARGRLMAVRAARVDAMRRLAERIRGVLISSETSVRDFVAESDQVDVSMSTFIRGARERGIRYHTDELIVEVQMSLTLRDLLVHLKSWGTEHYKGNKLKIKQFDKLIVQTKDKTIKETGMGVPPEQYLKEVTVAEKAVMSLGAKAPLWATRPLRAVGNAAVDTENANIAQAKLMAYRAAELDARRKLAEKIDGLMITSETSVHDFVATSDEIYTAMLTFQQGGGVVEGSQKLMEDGTAQVTVEIEMKPLWNTVLYYQKKLSIKIR